jgi:hypothetical protein
MASQFGIAASDLHPDPIPDTVYDELTDCDNDGIADVDVDDVIVAAENECISYMGGMFTEAANIALGKPHAIMAVVFRLHLRRAQNSAYKIPDEIKEAYKAAIAWFKSDGKALLSAEGETTPADGGGTETGDVDDTTYSMTNLDVL